MNCEKMKLLMMDFLYEELDRDEEQAFQAHLKSCPTCANELESLRQTHDLMAAMPDPESVGERLVFQAGRAGGLFDWLRSAKALLPGSRPGRIALTGLSVLVAFMLLGSLVNLRITYDHSGLQISMGRAHTLSEQQLTEIVGRLQEENARMLTTLLAEERVRQQQELDKVLTAFARSIAEQRKEDLQLIGRGLEAVQQRTTMQFNQTDQYLRTLVQQVYSDYNR